MLIVGCQSCGEAKILAGTPDGDGIARINWTCPHCGAGQVLQLEVSPSARAADLHSVLGGMALRVGNRISGIDGELEGLGANGFGD
ncbi:MAG: alcohol dehydrogenase [Synergistaceae bacterium]|jgi:ribosomal protein S27AE|nr:alcohol dehydrogenase [Synergistaceae bacterium]